MTTATKPRQLPKDVHDVPEFRAAVDRLMDCRNDITDVNHRLSQAMFQPEEYVSPIEREAEARIRGEEYKPDDKLETLNALHHELSVLRRMETALEKDVERVRYEVAGDLEPAINARMATATANVLASASKLHAALKSLHDLQEFVYCSGVPYFGNGHNRVITPIETMENLIRECGSYEGENHDA